MSLHEWLKPKSLENDKASHMQLVFFYCLSAPKIRVQQNRTKGLITNHLYVREK